MTAVLLPLQWLAIRSRSPRAARLPHLWHRGAARLIGLRIACEGAPAAGRPLLLLSNHVSWLDIVVLGAALPVSFVAKSEVAGWPVVSLLARLQRTVFVERDRRTRTGAQASEIAARLAAGDVIVLFAEGTSGDGASVLPFRSALVGAAGRAVEAGAGGAAALIQPVAVVYTAEHGLPLDRLSRTRVSWTGDMDLAPHLLAMLAEGTFDVTVVFGTPIALGPGDDRKAATRAAEAAVRRMLAATLRGAGAPARPASGAARGAEDGREAGGAILKVGETG
ncbi:1-acyl-sn-glycerol-3-phosphate acyltransferase [Methylobrevis sp. L22]|uniref:1-acyl-sn-glycerol-3-phosphate acyltransferase n=2 Tax=Methylobrevis albus TaxID=2793297 RepID=A0A931I1L8_9HYPH|nr:1-acyl-sn-glycerol-3-phosphate acyltransferase [Methylobrevis albus]